jgi:hypothetical protein
MPSRCLTDPRTIRVRHLPYCCQRYLFVSLALPNHGFVVMDLVVMG